jgi:hypothetical protein
MPVRLPQEILELAPPAAWALGRVVFAQAEFQIVDRETEQANEMGEASHEAYKNRQKQAVMRRLKLGALGAQSSSDRTAAAASQPARRASTEVAPTTARASTAPAASRAPTGLPAGPTTVGSSPSSAASAAPASPARRKKAGGRTPASLRTRKRKRSR